MTGEEEGVKMLMNLSVIRVPFSAPILVSRLHFSGSNGLTRPCFGLILWSAVVESWNSPMKWCWTEVDAEQIREGSDAAREVNRS